MVDLITVDKENRVFHLHNEQLSYIFSIEDGDTISHLYFGKRVKSYHGQLRYPRVDRGFSGNLPGSLDRTFSKDTLPQEYSSAGEMDYRVPATVVRQKDGSNGLMLKYKTYKVEEGKPELTGLPAAYVESESEANTLIVTLEDEKSGVLFDLLYTIYRDYPIITRSVKVKNLGQENVNLEKVASMQIDFSQRDFDVISLPGAHVNERHLERQKLGYGIQTFGSIRGTSSHQMNPFVALVDSNTDEFNGAAYGFALVYSGNHAFEIEKDQLDQVRLLVGINGYNFNWQLPAGESFQTPEVLMTYTDNGLNAMSKAFHNIIRDRITRSKYKYKERPILVNNWEATYFDFDEDKLKPIVDEAKELGIEMFVLDDGWFGHRDDDNSSLGDWNIYEKKFPQGLKHFADYVHSKDLKFGIWFEPEMISMDSELYRSHPEYLMQVPGRQPSPSRNQYILDMTRKDVRDDIVDQISTIIADNDINYVKWDMNRNLSDIYSQNLPADRQGEVYHRYVLGVYDILERITSKFPDVLFEGCSGGGGRFDAGFVYYMPQSWTSDNTDAIARITIQYGTSLVYPPSMMTAHVSAVPNHQTGRVTPIDTRGAVAMSAVFGYELDLTTLTDEEKEIVKKQVNQYKGIRKLVQYGDFYRLQFSKDGNKTAWMFISPQKDEAVVMVCKVLAEAQPVLTKTKLYGLDTNRNYRDVETNKVYGGDELMELGFYDPIIRNDYAATMYHFKAE